MRACASGRARVPRSASRPVRRSASGDQARKDSSRSDGHVAHPERAQAEYVVSSLLSIIDSDIFPALSAVRSCNRVRCSSNAAAPEPKLGSSFTSSLFARQQNASTTTYHGVEVRAWTEHIVWHVMAYIVSNRKHQITEAGRWRRREYLERSALPFTCGVHAYSDQSTDRKRYQA